MDECRVILGKRKLYVEKENHMILEGHRNLTNGLWDIPIPYYDVYKKTLQTDNRIHPPTHAAIGSVRSEIISLISLSFV